MKTKMLVGIAAVALLSLMIANAYALEAPPTICGCTGFTPGFWKHNIGVALTEAGIPGYSPGEYSSFHDDWGHLTYDGVLDFVEDTGQWGTGTDALKAAWADLSAKGPGSVTTRTWAANWLNYVAGFAPFED